MDKLELGMKGNVTAFRPGDRVAGAVYWELKQVAGPLEIRFFWYTMGKGSQDIGLVATERIETPGPAGVQEFEFTAPAQPYSFSGRNLSVLWAVEMVFPKLKCHRRLEVIIAPTGQEIVLPRVG